MELLRQFTAATIRLIGDAAWRADRFGVAVSGGPDSLALLLLAHAAFPGRVAAATVDHQLRPESAAEAALVARFCGEIGMTHATLVPGAPISGSLQSAARAARYALLDDWRRANGLDWLMTAHHADDQLETLLMRLNRGSGVAGLSGIRARVGHLLRPLLGVRRAELAQLVVDHGWTAIDDPSNHDERFDRVRMRDAVSALSGVVDPIPAVASADALAQADLALVWMTDRLAPERIRPVPPGVVIDIAGLPDELVRRLMLRALSGVDAAREPPRGAALARALSAVAAGESAMLGDVILSRSGDNEVRLQPAPPRRAT